MPESVFRNAVTRIGHAPAGVSSIRGALFAGFAVLLAVWAFAGYGLIRSLGDVERRVAAEHDAYARAADAVSLIRRNVLEGSINVRDALIDSDDAARETYREQLRVLREEAERRVAEYVPQAQSAAERDEWASCRRGCPSSGPRCSSCSPTTCQPTPRARRRCCGGTCGRFARTSSRCSTTCGRCSRRRCGSTMPMSLASTPTRRRGLSG